MIIPDYLLEEVKKYCDIRNIQLIKNQVPSKNTREIEDFINNRMRKDRYMTRKQEEESKLLVRSGVDVVLSQIMKYKIESPIEEYLRDALAKEDLLKYFKSQHHIGTKIVDFACPLASLVVECDGKEYHHQNQLQIDRDFERDKYLARKGWKVLHLEGLAIRRNIKLCMDKIKDILKLYINL
jgi:very-short-patch-repair endonuclease